MLLVRTAEGASAAVPAEATGADGVDGTAETAVVVGVAEGVNVFLAAGTVGSWPKTPFSTITLRPFSTSLGPRLVFKCWIQSATSTGSSGTTLHRINITYSNGRIVVS